MPYLNEMPTCQQRAHRGAEDGVDDDGSDVLEEDALRLHVVSRLEDGRRQQKLRAGLGVEHSRLSLHQPTVDIPEPIYRISTPAMIPKMTTTPLWLRRWTSQCSSHVPTMNEKAVHSSLSIRCSAKYSVGGNGGTAAKPLWHGVDGEAAVGELGVADIHDLSVLQVNPVCHPNVNVHNLQVDQQSIARVRTEGDRSRLSIEAHLHRLRLEELSFPRRSVCHLLPSPK